MYPRCLQQLEHLLRAAFVLLAGGADEFVVGNPKPVPQGAELARNFVGELLRRLAGGGGRALDLLAVLVGAGEEERVATQRPLTARNGVADHGRVGVPDVRASIHVVDRSRDVELRSL